ncbi:hypothetical protein PPL_01316 [Heterostelium album PN500]|uniref:Uncharacterized protein n=1 Tax=Heterostelium pallidum (strain ATCC 26659 / Pp 5 / PN500) TaxID=670386 RepID=D3AYQ2_HETP5|nr:hypothetical protein PPL_01316 [Heterostelium album PN500]EFA86079.1 hypothetical protein PPL_01316 [Heterostelium album PN500]|eukprot:XP_020438185.1 hypothetical protein PPL_01316 [Heterostelium album PN500]
MSDGMQGKLFVTVLQAQNLVIKQEKSAAQEFVGALSSPLFQGIQAIQNFSTNNVKKLAPIFTVPGSLVVQGFNTIGDAIRGGASSESVPVVSSSAAPTQPSVGITASVFFENNTEEVFRTQLSENLTEPKWNESHTFNVVDPCSTVRFRIVLKSLSEKSDFLIGTAQMSLIDEVHLWGQKPVAKWINITKTVAAANSDDNNNSSEFAYTEDEIVGRIELQLQYKYRNVWDCVYHGKMLLLEKKYDEALEALNEAITNNPTNPKLYVMMVDCYLAQKQYGKAIESAGKIIQHDRGYIGHLKAARVLMAANQLEKAQTFIDKAKAVSDKSEEIYNIQMELLHLSEVDKINKLIDQGSNDFLRGEFITASEHFTKAIEINPHSTILYEMRAICFVCAKNNAAAILDTNKILEIDHNWPKVNNTFGGYMMKDGQINVMSKKRWFGLKSIFLFYYKDINELIPQGVICLNEFGCAPKPNQKVKFQLRTKDREYYLKVENPEEFDKWIVTLTKISKTKPKLPPIKEIQDAIIWRNIYQSKTDQKTSFMLPEVMMLPETLFVESGRLAFSIGDKIKAKLSSIPQSECTATGWLYKMGQVNKEWQRRYFLLHNNILYYCKLNNGDEKQPSITPTGTLPLDGAKLDVNPSSITKANAFMIMTALRRNFAVAADSDTDKERWLKAIVVASGAQLPVEEEKKPEEMPTSESLFSNRSRRVKSLRSVPMDPDSQQTQQQQQQFINNNNNNSNSNNDNQQSNHGNQQQSPKVTRRIGSNEMSSSESRYFAKFGLSENTIVMPSAPIISSKSNLNSSANSMPLIQPTHTVSSPANPSPTSSTPSSPHSSQRSLKSVYPTEMPNPTEYDDENEESNVGLVSGKKKSVNEETGEDEEKRCCKCTIQ